MKRSIEIILAAALAAATAVPPASAGYQRAAAPPLLLSPDLTEPWVLQLQPGRRGAQKRITDRPAPRLPARTTASAGGQAQKAYAIDPRFLPTTVAYDGKHAPGTIVIDTNNRFLYLVEKGGFARRYGVGVGRPGFEWAGTHHVTRKAEWPDWRPPEEMRTRAAAKGQILPVHMKGGPANPLGARALYLGSTLYRIHGSNEPWTIGHAVSSGCIRMRNEDVTDLYDRVTVGTKVIVI